MDGWTNGWEAGRASKASHKCATEVTTFGALNITVVQEEDRARLNESHSAVVGQKMFPGLDAECLFVQESECRRLEPIICRSLRMRTRRRLLEQIISIRSPQQHTSYFSRSLFDQILIYFSGRSTTRSTEHYPDASAQKTQNTA
jgi:hypothetical protein